MADFHTQMEVVQVAWAMLDKRSSGDVGTIFSCRNLIDASYNTSAKKDFHHNGDLLDKITHAYVILGKELLCVIKFILRIIQEFYYTV